MRERLRLGALLSLPLHAACVSFSWQSETGRTFSVGLGETGQTAFWVLANVSYAAMRAQANASSGWRALAFVCGLPGTLLTYYVVTEGSGRAYGIPVGRIRSHDAPNDDGV